MSFAGCAGMYVVKQSKSTKPMLAESALPAGSSWTRTGRFMSQKRERVYLRLTFHRTNKRQSSR